jgi:hypothetical protein
MEKMELMANAVKNFGVQLRIYKEPFAGLEEYDGGLRSRLFQTFDTGRLFVFIRSMETATLYFTEDRYGCHFCFFKANSLSDETGCIDIESNLVGGGGGATLLLLVPG